MWCNQTDHSRDFLKRRADCGERSRGLPAKQHRKACHECASGYRQLTAFDQTDGVFEGLQRAIQQADLVTSQLNLAMEAVVFSIVL